MAHPADCLFRHILKKLGILIHVYLNLSILSDRSFLYLPTQQVHHKLRTVANTKNRNTQFKNFLCVGWRIFQINTVWSTCKNNSFWINSFDFFNICFIRIDFAVHVTFAHTSCNQLIILSSEIKYNNGFSLQESFLLFFIINSFLTENI